MDLYINSAGIISGAGNNMSGDFLQDMPAYHTTTLLSVEPDYKEYIPVMQLRRMSKAVRMGVVSAKKAMEQAGIEKPDAISVGTAYGCLQDTEAFLGKMIDQEEQMLTPTAFIQSTHNTVSGQIALLAGCNGHNLTFVQRGHSFEHAAINTALYLAQHPGETMLLGGIDEQTTTSIKVLQQAGLCTTGNLTAANVLTGNNTAAVAGEGAAFFAVTNQPLTKQYVRIQAIEVFKADDDIAIEKIKAFVNNNGNGDVFISGMNGAKENTAFYRKVREQVFNNVPHALFKHLCGEYPVASSFALGLLYNGIQGLHFTDEQPATIKDVVLVNNHCNYYSCWKLQISG